MFADKTGYKAYVIRNDSTKKYELQVTSQALDFASDAVVFAATQLGGPFLGIGFYVGSAAFNNYFGITEIDYNPVSDNISASIDIADWLLNESPIPGVEEGSWLGDILGSKWITAAGVVKDMWGYGKDWFDSHQYQIEEAIFNHFEPGIWTSDTQEEVTNKYHYALQNIALLIAGDKIGVNKAKDIFTADSWPIGGSSLYDRLTERQKTFFKGNYYFNLVDDSASGALKKIEDNIKSGNY